MFQAIIVFGSLVYSLFLFLFFSHYVLLSSAMNNTLFKLGKQKGLLPFKNQNYLALEIIMRNCICKYVVFKHKGKIQSNDNVDHQIINGSYLFTKQNFKRIKRQLLLRRKAMTNLVIILKIRDIALPTKVHIFKVMNFLVVIYGCELDHKEN